MGQKVNSATAQDASQPIQKPLINTKHYWVYILHCNNDSYYTGYTNNLSKRYLSHVNATGKCKYTRSFKPLGIAQCWKITDDKSLAMQIERYIKNLSRAEKIKLISKPSLLSKHYQVIVVPKKQVVGILLSYQNK